MAGGAAGAGAAGAGAGGAAGGTDWTKFIGPALQAFGGQQGQGQQQQQPLTHQSVYPTTGRPISTGLPSLYNYGASAPGGLPGYFGPTGFRDIALGSLLGGLSSPQTNPYLIPETDLPTFDPFGSQGGGSGGSQPVSTGLSTYVDTPFGPRRRNDPSTDFMMFGGR